MIFDLNMPDIDFTILKDLAAEPWYNKTIDVYDLEWSNIGSLETIDLGWSINYTGDHNMTEIVSYKDPNMPGHWMTLRTDTGVANTTTSGTFQIYVANWDPGEYEFMVKVDSQDAGSDYETVIVDLARAFDSDYIKLE